MSIDAQVQSARGSVFYQKAKWGQIFKSFLNFFKFSNISFFKNFPHFEKSKKGPQVFLKTLLFLGIFPVFYLRSRCLCLKKSIFTQSLTKFVTLVQQNHKKSSKNVWGRLYPIYTHPLCTYENEWYLHVWKVIIVCVINNCNHKLNKFSFLKLLFC